MKHHQPKQNIFDDQLLSDFIHNFYGYGSYHAEYWFIGMEEGGGNSFTEITSRLNAWDKRGRRELEDVAEYHTEIGITHLFNEHPKIQPTWNKLIRILLSAKGQMPTTEQVRKYQRLSLGRIGGNTCLLELLPLPSPSTDQWLYGQHSRLPHLADRETYKQKCLVPRMQYLKQQIHECKPKAVIFYSFSYLECWREIAGNDFALALDGEAYWFRKGSNIFVVTKHPAAWGVTNRYFHQVGKMIGVELLKNG